jgi:hypothetical protein
VIVRPGKTDEICVVAKADGLKEGSGSVIIKKK